MPTAPSAFPLLGAPQAPGDKPNLPEGSKSLGGEASWGRRKSPAAETQSAGSELQTDLDRNLLVLELLPYMLDGLAHYAEKVGDTQQK